MGVRHGSYSIGDKPESCRVTYMCGTLAPPPPYIGHFQYCGFQVQLTVLFRETASFFNTGNGSNSPWLDNCVPKPIDSNDFFLYNLNDDLNKTISITGVVKLNHKA
jgi:hypothetical protein